MSKRPNSERGGPAPLWFEQLQFTIADLTLITDRCPDAIPGHGELVDESLLEFACDYGRRQILPLADSGIREPAYTISG
jgi:hypothetical protein